MKKKNVYIIAGPNGSGKTTFAKKFLPLYAKCLHFVNADLIAQGLSPFSPQAVAIKAGKLVLKEIHDMTEKNIDFAFETTLSGKSYIKLLKHLKRKGYCLHLFFLWIPNAQLALARIKDRVAEGGHNVPVQDVHRRFRRSTRNFFEFYKSLFDSWLLFNNEGVIPHLIAEEKNKNLIIFNECLFEKIARKAAML